MDRQRPRLLVGIDVVQYQRLNVAVEDDPHQFAGPVYDRAARVSADDIRGIDEIEGRGKIQPALCSIQLFGSQNGS